MACVELVWLLFSPAREYNKNNVKFLAISTKSKTMLNLNFQTSTIFVISTNNSIYYEHGMCYNDIRLILLDYQN